MAERSVNKMPLDVEPNRWTAERTPSDGNLNFNCVSASLRDIFRLSLSPLDGVFSDSHQNAIAKRQISRRRELHPTAI